jgi:O-antigen/teichoic acid export membrane protein
MLQDTPTQYLWLAAALAPPALFYLLGSALLVGLEHIRAYNCAEVASRVLVFVGMLAAGVAGAGAGGFIAAAIIAWIVAAIGVGALVSRGSRFVPWFDTEVFRRGVRFALKAYLATLLSFLVLRSNVFLLRREWGPEELGLYSIAAQINDVLLIVPQTVNLLLFPRLVRSKAGRWRTTVRASWAVTLAMVVGCALTAAVASPAIRLLFGAEFEPAATVLYIFLPGVVFLAAAGVYTQYLSSVGLPKETVGLWAFALIVVTVLSVLLIPDHAGAGAAAALSATYAVYLCLIITLARRFHRRHPDEESIDPSVARDVGRPAPRGQ